MMFNRFAVTKQRQSLMNSYRQSRRQSTDGLVIRPSPDQTHMKSSRPNFTKGEIRRSSKLADQYRCFADGLPIRPTFFATMGLTPRLFFRLAAQVGCLAVSFFLDIAFQASFKVNFEWPVCVR